MNQWELEVWQQRLEDEVDTLKVLEASYRAALESVDERIAILKADEVTQSKIYQIEYQERLQVNLEGLIGELAGENFVTVAAYLNRCYDDGFVGSLYSLQMQGAGDLIQLSPNEAQIIKVINLTHDDVPLSTRLYSNTGELVDRVRAEISRGFASAMSYTEIARNVEATGMTNLYQAQRIVQTEGHRVTIDATMDAMRAAKEGGADIVKQWDSTLDSRTRPEHQSLDGQVKEIDEPFEVDGMEADAPGGFGIAHMDINCRCAVLQRARWALDREGQTRYSGFEGEHGGIVPYQSYGDFKNAWVSENEKTQGFGSAPMSVDWGLVKSAEYRKRFDSLSDNAALNELVYKESLKMLAHRDNTGLEDFCVINSLKAKVIGRSTNAKVPGGVLYTSDLKNKIMRARVNGEELVVIHNHPESLPPSADDIESLKLRGYHRSVVVGHNGNTFVISGVNDTYTPVFYTKTYEKALKQGLSEYDSAILSLNKMEDDYGLKWRELK